MDLRDNTTNLKALFSLERSEKTKAVLMFVYNFILLNTLYLLKPVRDSLFLEQAGAQNLPFVFIFTAIAVIPISMGYSKLSSRLSIGWIINIVTLFLAFNLFLIWFFIDVDNQILYYAFYIWVSIYSVLITSQFWLFANTIFDPVQSKKVFGFLSLGAILGGFSGGELTAILINKFSFAPEFLLLICAIVLVATAPLVFAILRTNPGTAKQPEGQPTDVSSVSQNPLKEILNNNHLLLITGLIAITVIVTTLVDFQFKSIAENAFANESALTSFMGKFYGRVSLIAFLLQFFVGTFFTKKYGVAGSILLLPVALLISSGGLLFFPGLIAGTMTRGIDQSLKHSIDRTGRELLFVPLSNKLKKRVKVFLDLFVDHGAQGLTGLLLLGLTFGLNFGIHELSIVIITLLLFWIAISKMVSNSYVDQFRKSIKKRVESNTDEHHPKPPNLDSVFRLLKSGRKEDVLKALNILRDTEEELPLKSAKELLHHDSSQVRLLTLALLREQDQSNFMDQVIDLVYDPSPDVRTGAIRYVYQFYEGDLLENLKIGLSHDDARIRAAAFGLVAEEGGQKEQELITDQMLEEALDYDDVGAQELRRQTAHLLGEVYTPKRAKILKTLLNDDDPAVVEQAIESAGKTQDRRFVHHLILLLGDDIHRRTVESALGKYSNRIFGTLYDHMTDNQIPESTRRYVPWLFSQTVSVSSWKILEMSLNHCSISIRHGVIKALRQMQMQDDNLEASEQVVAHNTGREIERYSKFVQVAKLAEKKNIPNYSKIEPIVEYEIDQAFENIFRLLSLRHNSKDIYNAYYGIIGDDSSLRVNAIEFIENLISWDIRKHLLPILENYPPGDTFENSFTNQIATENDAISFLREISHPAIEEAFQEHSPTNTSQKDNTELTAEV